MSAESPEQNEHFIRVVRRRFRDWRGTRPFWAGLFTLLGGIPIAYFPYASLHLGQMTLSMATTAGSGSLIIGVLLVTLGLTMWFQHAVRIFAGVAAILLALVSIPLSNFGGFVIGYLLALIGGALSIAWAPGQPESERAGERAPLADGPPEPLEPLEPVDTPEYHTETTVDANGGRNSAG
ncbi:DUF6114 domain-containing protein [Streptomyces thermolilacinus]|uniref:Integral membrane protein n=1 Tax=Streptomyces thermolilacinus SPC6 TaxID=1306406 RepID=A0A1D3DPV3_9ACTN|nr:DUF6114 domain-containing protein [Streptomyces thermolilacinus]OEJ94344.1 hypothetical protein J116_007560 [Streptomyces thermolilacinus SPC6]